MPVRQPFDLALANVVSADRLDRAAEERRARSIPRAPREGGPLRPLGRVLVRLGVALGGGPEPRSTRTLGTVRPR